MSRSELKFSPRVISPTPQMSRAVPTTGIAKRRSGRIGLSTLIGLSGEDRDKRTFNMTANATNLNRHGAAIQLTRELLVGSTILVRNKPGIQTSARVVAQVNTTEGFRTYGIEFLENSEKLKGFWGISFPSA